MKRKIFSKLLMGAILFASVSAFVSCKDYDDDINANKADIKAAQEQLATLSSSLTSLQQKLEAEKVALQKELADAKSSLETQIANAKAELNAAIAKKADQSTVDALVTRVANLETDLAATKEAFNAKIEAINTALAKLEALIEKKADQTYVDQAIATLTAAISGKVSTEDFNAFKAEVAKIETNLSNLTTLVNTKADQATVDAAIAAINKDIAQLQKDLEAALAQQKKDFDAAIAQIKSDMEKGKEEAQKALATKADKSALDALTEKVNGLSEAVAALQTAIATKAEKAEVEALSNSVAVAVAGLQEQINKLVTPEQLNAAVTKLENAIAALESATNAKIDLLKSETEKELQKKANQADFSELKAAFEALKASYERHGENIALMISDAINALDSKLTAIIDTKVDQDEFDATVEDLQGQIDDITEDIAGILETLIAVNGDIDNLNDYITAVAGKSKEVDSVLATLITTNALGIAALDIQVAAIEGFLADFLNEDGSMTSLKEEFAKASQEVKDSLAKQDEKRAAAIAEVVAKIVEVKTDLASLDSKLYNLEDGDITKLKAQFANIDNIVQDKINANLAAMTLFINRILTSITLIPKNYIDGIEAIKFRSIRYIPQVTDYAITPANYADAVGYPNEEYIETEGTAPGFYFNFADHQLANKQVNRKDVDPVIIDNKKTTVEYRVSPKLVSLDQIDAANIKMYAHYAATETRAVATGENKPVKPTFVSLDKGVLTVSLEKTVTDPIYFEGEGSKGIIAALSVPRKADEAKGVESTEVFSEYSLLDEETIVPRIAALPWTKAHPHNAASPMDYHFIDSLHIFKSMTDADMYVKAEIDYDKSFDLLQLVTGCYGVFNQVTKEITGHNEITKDELAQYGLKFKFALPKTYAAKSAYNYNYTDQQPFAQLNGSIIQAKLPQDQVIYGNRAVIGKEPIVRVMLIDTVRHNLVDQAYFKVKFKDTLEDKDPIDVEYSDTITLNCESNRLRMTWDKFVNLVYAKLKDSEGETTGMSWEQFRKYYPQTSVYRGNLKFDNYENFIEEDGWDLGRGRVTIYWLADADAYGYAPSADANELYWYLSDYDINVIPKDTRMITKSTTVTFKSNDSKVYGPINLKLNLTVKLPKKPEIVGYNENQWFVSKEKFYVQPVQYGTTNNKDVRPEFVEYDFNITQQFTVTTSTNAGANKAAGTWTNWIVKGLPYDCGSWDVEFAKPANGLGYRSAYQAADVNIASQLTAVNDAYRYVNSKANNAQALKLWWKGDDNHYSWTTWDSSDILNPFFILHGDKSTANQIVPLLNDLSKNNRSDGWTPEKTYDDNKAIDMNVWARYNKYNYETITSFKAYLVTPIRINFTAPGVFEDNWVSGTVVDAAGKLGITDFVGYAVAKSLNSFTAAQRGQERYKYAEKLWHYYGIQDPVFNLGDDDVIYGLKLVNGNLVVDNDVTVDETGAKVINGGMKGSQVAAATAGGYTPSLTEENGFLLYKNKQGREFEQPYNVFVPVTIKHIFGTLKTYVPFPVYPKGKAAGDGYEVKAGPEVTSRLAK